MWFLETNNVISKHQAGFRNFLSSSDYIIQLENTIRQEIAKKRHRIATFCDIQKAYDTTWRHYVIMKLQEYRLRGHFVHFINKYKPAMCIQIQLICIKSFYMAVC